jgi:hypothetical protein
MWCATKKNQIAARNGSAVLPVELPAVAQVIKETKAKGKMTSVILLTACCEATSRVCIMPLS